MSQQMQPKIAAWLRCVRGMPVRAAAPHVLSRPILSTPKNMHLQLLSSQPLLSKDAKETFRHTTRILKSPLVNGVFGAFTFADCALAAGISVEAVISPTDQICGADPQGYLYLAADNGDLAYSKWSVRAVFVKGTERPNLLDYAYWQLVSGTGQFANKTGVGTLIIKAASPTDCRFILTGELGEKP